MVDVLDHGYVKLITHHGSDELVIESARMSTDGSFRGWGTKEKPGDERLLAYLYKHKHHTPFEMAGAIFEVKLPIFVAREWMRHRTLSYNEMSARYIPIPDMDYIPSVERIMMNADGTNKQAGRVEDATPITLEEAVAFRSGLAYAYGVSQGTYETALKMGVPKELARVILPVGRYTKMRVSANLRNWIAFLRLRMAPDAQYEIRVYAEAIYNELKALYPRTFELVEEDFKQSGVISV